MSILFSFLNNIIEIMWNLPRLCPLCFVAGILVKVLYIVGEGLFEACSRLSRFHLVFVVLVHSITLLSFSRLLMHRFFENHLEILGRLSDLVLGLLAFGAVFLLVDFVVCSFLMFGLIFVIFKKIDLYFFVIFHFIHCLITFLLMLDVFLLIFQVFQPLINYQNLLIVCCHRLILTILKKILLSFS